MNENVDMRIMNACSGRKDARPWKNSPNPMQFPLPCLPFHPVEAGFDGLARAKTMVH